MVLSACSPKLENFGNRLYQRKKELLEPVAKFDIDPILGGTGSILGGAGQYLFLLGQY